MDIFFCKDGCKRFLQRGLLALILLFPSFLYAGYGVLSSPLSNGELLTKSHFVASFLLGLNHHVNLGDGETVLVAKNFTNTYTNNDIQNYTGLVAAAFGFEIPSLANITTQVLAEVDYSPTIKLGGDVWQFSEPEFNNFTYQYKMASYQFFATFKFLLAASHWLNPFVFASLGLSRNCATSFEEFADDDTGVINAPFADKSINQFAYALGAGLALNVTRFFRVSLLYRYLNIGMVELGPSTSQLTQANFATSQLNFNQFCLLVSYQF